MSNAQVVDDRQRERYEILIDGEVAGYAQYRRGLYAISFRHTVIEERFEGRGLATTLIGHALDAARDEGLGVLPFCPFVRAYIVRHPDPYLDLVPENRREQFSLPAAG
jgi:predicted GNAT family acetyltransferase